MQRININSKHVISFLLQNLQTLLVQTGENNIQKYSEVGNFDLDDFEKSLEDERNKWRRIELYYFRQILVSRNR